ncbi:MAG: inositol monophosphatase [Spirochaetales bacterium]|nr:inositol monophosphatase [Spirochaetales bacterium]
MNETLIAIVKEAGTIAKSYFFGEATVDTKAPYDLVTNADKIVEEFLMQKIAEISPEATIYGEESGYTHKKDKNHLFVIDPIDGTANFVFRVPYFAVSLAEIRNGEVVTAIVYNPISEDLFYADKESPALLNGFEIQVSPRSEVNDSLVIFGFSANSSYIARYQKEWPHVMDRAKKGMPLLSPSLNLCSIASGRVDGYIDFKCSFEGQVAGAFILQKAGGTVTNYLEDSYDFTKEGIVATNGTLKV